MQVTEKFRSDLDLALARVGSGTETARLEAIRAFFYGSFARTVPQETLADLFTAFLSKWQKGEERALAWLSGVGSLLLMDYDGTPFSRDEWTEIRDAITLEQGEIDLDLLSYVLTLVVDHGAI